MITATVEIPGAVAFTSARLDSATVRDTLRARGRRGSQPRWMMPLLRRHPFPELQCLACDVDTVRQISPMQKALGASGDPFGVERFPVLSVRAQTFGVADGAEQRFVLAAGADGRVLAWETVVYDDGRMRVTALYHGPSVRLAVEKLNVRLRQAEWANSVAAKVASLGRSEPVCQRDASSRLRRMRAFRRAQSPLRYR